MNKSVSSSAKQQGEITTFFCFDDDVSMQIFNSLYLIDGAYTKPVVAFFVNIVKCEQDEINKSQNGRSQLRLCLFSSAAVIFAKAP